MHDAAWRRLVFELGATPIVMFAAERTGPAVIIVLGAAAPAGGDASHQVAPTSWPVEFAADSVEAWLTLGEKEFDDVVSGADSTGTVRGVRCEAGAVVFWMRVPDGSVFSRRLPRGSLALGEVRADALRALGADVGYSFQYECGCDCCLGAPEWRAYADGHTCAAGHFTLNFSGRAAYVYLGGVAREIFRIATPSLAGMTLQPGTQC